MSMSIRQASEWGMRALQGTFCRLCTRLSPDGEKRQQILLGIVLAHNFRTEIVGLNQIATVFHPEYEACINLQSYDRIRRYYANVFDDDDSADSEGDYDEFTDDDNDE
jgi:hypothetical protein